MNNDEQSGRPRYDTVGKIDLPSVTRIGVYWTAPRIVAFVAAISLIAWPWVTVMNGDMGIFDPRLVFGVCVSAIVAVVAGSTASIAPKKVE